MFGRMLGWTGRLGRFVTALSLLGSLASLACAGSDASGGIDDDFMDDPPPPGNCDTDCPTQPTTGSPIDGPCLNTNDCLGDAFCAADFDGDVGDFTCQVACIPQMDESQWCSDSASCCEDNVCSSRGFCVPPMPGLDSGDSGSTGTTGTTGTGSSGSDSSGTDSSGSSGTDSSGSGSGSSSSTG